MEYRQQLYEFKNFIFTQKYKKTILCIARISKPKRFDIFLDVASLLPAYAFVWIGNTATVKAGLENVFCLGNIPEAGKCNQFADLFMLASDYEGLPIVILEAMSYGKPVVASNVGGIGEIVVNGENGYTVENAAPKFADKIQYILEDESIYKRFSENAYKRYKEYLTVEKMVQGYIEIYRKKS
jgi:glycosyltransferase involved in cell wall biosynthesis